MKNERSLFLRRVYRYLRAKALSLGVPKIKAERLSRRELESTANISLVLPIHDAPEVTLRCILSLQRNAGAAQIILIDDGSKQEATRQVISQAIETNGWQLVKNDEPQGHSRACEQGAALAQRKYICLLNSDTVVTPWSWLGVTRAFEEDSRIAVVGPATSRTASVQVVKMADYCRFYWTDEQIDGFAYKYTAKHANDMARDIPHAMGFAFFVRKDVWKEMNGFDLELPDYGNEVELCERISAKGYRIVWTPGSYIHHFGASSFNQRFSREQVRSLREQGMEYVLSKHLQKG